MSSRHQSSLVALLSCLIATSAFLLSTINPPIPLVNISNDQAISILRESDKTDHRIVNGSQPISADLRYTSLDLSNSIPKTDFYHHSRIYASTTNSSEFKPYWFIDYETSFSIDWGGSGRYIVDAQTGEIMLSLESLGGGIVIGGPDYGISTKPFVFLWDSSMLSVPTNFTQHALEAKLGGFTPLVLRLDAPSYYDASLPVSVKVIGVSRDFHVSQNVTSSILRTGGYASFLFQVFTPVTYADSGSVSQPQDATQVPHMDVKISFLGETNSYSIFLTQTN